ncbi:MAG: Type 1 glutamine amidotransferase-like domain-containing protein [Clostridia bacterium]|nr:Type 1 glutamine amidotransferase-like domain-containing protein [Clostridia bacterium]
MVLFLTSSPCDDNVPEGVELPCIFDVRNGFVENLQACFEPGMSGIIIAADPDNHEMNDEMAQTFENCFAYHDMPLSSFTLVDSRNEEELPRLMATAGIVVLSGGHVPTENAFFRRLNLREMMQEYDGIVMGISAGTMNCASEVYAQPEEAGEATDPDYERFIEGLGLTWVNVLPHYQKVKNYMIDGMRLFEDVTYQDSHGRVFYALVDGSYILADEEGTTLFGEAYAVSDGELYPICGEEEFIPLDE